LYQTPNSCQQEKKIKTTTLADAPVDEIMDSNMPSVSGNAALPNMTVGKQNLPEKVAIAETRTKLRPAA